ncbi:putative bromodomain-containing protein 10 isoform 2-T2 [Leptodactylus fuscus]|uniref:putative bromodomain-containing protein 10 isoform X2 n=1 Tax=Leptodactylus fuscus TaxID=238119 RepID=UPI003F4EFAE9
MEGVSSGTVSPLKENERTSPQSVEQVPGTVTVACAAASEEGSEAAPVEDVPAVITEPYVPGDDGKGAMSVAHTPGSRAAAPTMSLLKMEEKFSSGQYRAIGDFVSDFRTMLEGCYQLHGADHWLSKQAQKLELMLEQKLSLLSRNLRDKTSAAICTKNDKPEEDTGYTSTRRRSSARNLANINSGTMESVMVQVLKQAEFLRAKEEKRIKEQEKKEAEEANQKEMEDWDRGLLALAAPSTMETMWEIPAIGHFLCLAQQILNLPEIVFYELERCLLMPQCNVFLAKIMTSLLSPPHRRPTIHRRPNLPYKAWESALRQKVQQWYTVVGQAENPDRCAEKLGLCSQFFKVLGEVNPLEQKTFHELTFYQKVWLLKGLCDFVYETQSEVQDAVLGQPIHECREVILGYDSQENAYIHFPQFCGADVRVYKQRPFKAPEFPIPSIKIKRTPRVKSKRSKCKYSAKRNGIFKNVKKVASSTYSTNPEKCCDFKEEGSTNCQLDDCKCFSDNDKKPDDGPCHDCNVTVSCKENVEKPISPGELVGYGEPLSPGEIRILENVDKYAEATLLKTDTSPLKENALKTYQVNLNGNYTDSTEVICHRVAMDIILDNPLINNKKLKLGKMRAKKKKKKKKIKALLNENIQGKCENLQTHTFKSEIHNKLFLNRKQTKHKKHKSGKKSVSKKTVIKKRRLSAASPAPPEFQLVCTNLTELRELIKKINRELKCMENNKKKSGKWHFRRQGVKELHSTLTRLLNELLPWEPKLQKAFQKNRARLRKDYDDFLKLTNSEILPKESYNCGELEAKKSPNSVSKTFATCQEEKDSPEKLAKLEVGVCGKSKITRQDSCLKELPGRSCKRLNRQCSSTDNEENDVFPQKKNKLSPHEVSSSSSEGRAQVKCLEDQQQIDPDVTEIREDAMCVSPLDTLKGTKPIQALLAKNLGNKVTLTSHVAQSLSVSQNVEDVVPVQSALSGQTSLKTPLQMMYKLPDGHCVPVLQNPSVKIQVQPVLDTKTGDKLMQQVLLLPKNLFIKHKDEKLLREDNHLTQPDICGKFVMPNVSPSISSVGYINAEETAQPVTAFNKTTVHSTTCSTVVVSQPSVTSFACSTTVSSYETSKSSAPILTASSPASVVPSVMCTPIYSDFGGLASNTGKTVMASHIVNSSQTDTSEGKQELKTVCIRDSQSILVRTRGGNTGLVKVQPSQEQVSPVSNSIFTVTPHLQSFLVSRNKSAPPNYSPIISSPGLQTSSISGGRNYQSEINTKSTPLQYPTSRICNTAEKSVHSSNVTTVHPGNRPTVSQDTTNIGNIPACSSSGQSASTINKNTHLKQRECSISVVQPDTTTPPKGDLLSGSSLHKVVLITPPSILPSTNPPKISMLTTSAVTPQKLVFINTQVPTSSSNINVALQTSKPAAPTIIGKTFVKPTESPQIILIPSTMTSPIKTSSASIVSQVKDVKIGLTIGQTIVNSTSGAKNVLPFNILQKTLGKADANSHKDFAISSVEKFDLKGQNGQIPSSNLIHTVPITKAPMACPVMATAKPVSVQSCGSDLLKTLPPFSKSACFSNGGSTVALSTVKTGHLSSSVMLSPTQMTGPAKAKLSSLQIPVTTTSLGESSHSKTSMAGACQPVNKELLEKTQHVSERFPKMLSTNAPMTQVAVTSPLIPALCKTNSVNSPYQSLPPFSSTTVTQLNPQINDPCTHQKLVINTSTPLAPGTQITINGTRLIVPPQGLGAGSHVLLLSTNTKQGLSLLGSSGQTCPSTLLSNTTVQQHSLKQNLAPVQSSGQPLKTAYSVATTKMLPSVQNITPFVNTTSKLGSPCPVSSIEGISTCPALASVPQPRIVPCIPQGSYLQTSKLMQLPKSIPVKEVILGRGNYPTNPSPASVVSEHNMADDTRFVYQSKTSENQHTVAS